jgi:MFS transporter, MHS family, shikimate and dehydroshikimate transport protein
MDRVGGEQTGQTSSIKQVATASFIGTTIEWYDFFLYGTAAALVFGQLFFPYANPLIGTLSSSATFAVAFVARPFGEMIFGHYGDRSSSRTTVRISSSSHAR